LKKSFAMPELIIISKGKEFTCLFDQCDQELISRYSWSLHSKGYAQTTIGNKTVLMHRLILGIVDNPEIEVDHRFHNRLDNRRSKIRPCTHSENRRNARKLKESAHSQYKGIYNDLGRWHVQIMQDEKVKNLGRYNNEITAAKVYDNRAIEIFKDYAFVNFQSSMEARQLTFPWL
jgi:hypothetical protein